MSVHGSLFAMERAGQVVEREVRWRHDGVCIAAGPYCAKYTIFKFETEVL